MVSIRDNLMNLRTAQKPSTGAPAYSRYINRPLGRLFAAIAGSLNVSPTQVTLASGSMTIGGIVVLALVPPTFGTSLLVTALLVLGYALDAADGQLSRLTSSSSLAGEWLDHFLDAFKAATIHLAVFVSFLRFFDIPRAWLAVPLAFGAASTVFFLGIILADLLRRIYRLSHPTAIAPERQRTSFLYSLAVVPNDYGLLCIIFLTVSFHWVFVVIYSLLALFNVLLLPAAGFRWYRSLRRLEAMEN